MHHPLLEVASVEVLAPAGVAAAIESAPSVAYAALVAPHGPWREELAAALEPLTLEDRRAVVRRPDFELLQVGGRPVGYASA